MSPYVIVKAKTVLLINLRSAASSFQSILYDLATCAVFHDKTSAYQRTLSCFVLQSTCPTQLETLTFVFEIQPLFVKRNSDAGELKRTSTYSIQLNEVIIPRIVAKKSTCLAPFPLSEHNERPGAGARNGRGILRIPG